MDTPKRAPPPPAPPAQQQTDTPRHSKFEESPVFNYINSLSPIMPVKPVHISQTFHHSINFSSIPPIFTSPHVTIPHKESSTRPFITTRLPLSDLSTQDFFPQDGRQDTDIISSGVSSIVVPPSEHCRHRADAAAATCSQLHDHPDTNSVHPPFPLHYHSTASPNPPNHLPPPGFGDHPDCRFVIGTTTSLIEFVHDDALDDDTSAFIPTVPHHFDASPLPHPHPHAQDGRRQSHWEDLVAHDSDPLFIFSPSHQPHAYGDHFQDFAHLHPPPSPISHQSSTMLLPKLTAATAAVVDPHTHLHPLLPSDHTHHRVHDLDALTTDLPSSSVDAHAETNTAATVETTDHTPLDFSVCQNNNNTANPSPPPHPPPPHLLGAGNIICDDVSTTRKAISQNQRGMRRRCLVFDITGQRENMLNDPDCNSLTPLQHHHVNPASPDTQPPPNKPALGPPKCMLPSIGLHLNSLASVTKDLVITQHNLHPGTSFIAMPVPYPVSQYPPPSLHEPPSFPSNDAASSDAEAQDLQVTQESTQENASLDGEEMIPTSPRKKKRKSETTSESDGCKRCHCKKSKCLKLYCECFAAGVYCVEPCTCQGCFNKPMHEDTVLATRKQIESRNPLAFAPKVIRTSEPVPESGEDANKTPASARHKRGCNCKKSSCLKKYCECYQGGVGCSISCRCEGCKNTFGRKEGITPLSIKEPEPEEKELSLVAYRDEEKTDVPLGIGVRGADQFPECTLTSTPSSQTLRPHLPFVSAGKPPRASTPAIVPSRKLIATKAFGDSDSKTKLENKPQVFSDDDTPDILLMEPAASGVKVASPNKKRVSPPHAAIIVSPSPSRKGCRKLILKSIPSFPSLTSDPTTETSVDIPSGSLNPQLLS